MAHDPGRGASGLFRSVGLLVWHFCICSIFLPTLYSQKRWSRDLRRVAQVVSMSMRGLGE